MKTLNCLLYIHCGLIDHPDIDVVEKCINKIVGRSASIQDIHASYWVYEQCIIITK